MPTIKQQVEELGMKDKVIFTGVVTNANEYMMAMDCFIFPSIFEGFPVSVLEAQATGLPVVMNDVITKEVDLSDLIHRVSLEQPATIWARIVDEAHVKDRSKYYSVVAKSCYNIKTAVKNFELLYSNLVKKIW